MTKSHKEENYKANSQVSEDSVEELQSNGDISNEDESSDDEEPIQVESEEVSKQFKCTMKRQVGIFPVECNLTFENRIALLEHQEECHGVHWQ